MAKKKSTAIHKLAKKLKARAPSLTWREAHGVAKGIKSGKGKKRCS